MYKKVLFSIIFLLVSVLFLEAQSVGVVLSGGGAKGIAHIGVIKALEENGIPIDYVAGTSMGGIVAGLYAIGLTPDEMMQILNSDEFKAWSAGKAEKDEAQHLYHKTPTPDVLGMSFAVEKDKEGESQIKFVLPMSLVASFPMDMAIVQMFASASAAAENDFNNLMVPFFCVSSDISKKKHFISTKGDLGPAIRASMTYPGFFKPISIDSTLLFDGGLYNNFPYKEMKEIFKPDFIIGSKCVVGTMNPEDEDAFGQIELMLSVDTNYDIPEEEGVLIDDEYDYGLMEFEKAEEIAQKGYNAALRQMDLIKSRVSKRVSGQEINKKRIDFRMKCPELIFDSVIVEGNINQGDKTFIENTLLRDERDTINFEELKNGYYQLVASEYVSGMYPTVKFNSDSLFTLNLKVKKKNLLTLNVGGNIATSSLTQVYLGLSYKHLSRYPYRTSLDVDLGHFRQGVGLYFRQDIYDNPLVFYDLEYRYQKLNYSASEPSFIFNRFMSERMIEEDMYGKVNLGFPLSLNNNLLMKFGIIVGASNYKYFDSDYYSKYDVLDHTSYTYISPRLRVEKNTLNYLNYPTTGRKYYADAGYVLGIEDYNPGSLRPEAEPRYSDEKSLWHFRVYSENYFDVKDWFRFGYSVNLTASAQVDMANYYSAMMVNSAYHPTIHSTTIILDKYRAATFAGAAVNPIFMISPSIYIHTTLSYFQPYKRMLRTEDGGYTLSKILPFGSFSGNVAAVWQSPLGPISLSCAYYDNEGTKFFPLLNIGVLLENKKGLRR